MPINVAVDHKDEVSRMQESIRSLQTLTSTNILMGDRFKFITMLQALISRINAGEISANLDNACSVAYPIYGEDAAVTTPLVPIGVGN